MCTWNVIFEPIRSCMTSHGSRMETASHQIIQRESYLITRRLSWKESDDHLVVPISVWHAIESVPRNPIHFHSRFYVSSWKNGGRTEFFCANHFHELILFLLINMIITNGPVVPFCINDRTTEYVIGVNEEVVVTCDVESDPSEVIFKWFFTNSSGTTEVRSFSSSGTRSVLKYTPETRFSFGTLLCIAENRIGFQSQPCVFSIKMAGGLRIFRADDLILTLNSSQNDCPLILRVHPHLRRQSRWLHSFHNSLFYRNRWMLLLRVTSG